MFIEGLIYNTEEIIRIINERIGLNNDFEKLLLYVVKKNMHKVVQMASEKYPAFFISHLVDILATTEQLPKESSWRFEDMNYPEYYFWVYINEIYTNVNIPLEIICDYILNTLGVIKGIEELIKSTKPAMENENSFHKEFMKEKIKLRKKFKFYLIKEMK